MTDISTDILIIGAGPVGMTLALKLMRDEAPWRVLLLDRRERGSYAGDPRALALSHGTRQLLEPLGEKSPIAAFLEKNASGGMHHVCCEVDDILAARDRLTAAGARVIGDGNPKIGAHGKPVLFLHP